MFNIFFFNDNIVLYQFLTFDSITTLKLTKIVIDINVIINKFLKNFLEKYTFLLKVHINFHDSVIFHFNHNIILSFKVGLLDISISFIFFDTKKESKFLVLF
jgi:hypothetical protein